MRDGIYPLVFIGRVYNRLEYLKSFNCVQKKNLLRNNNTKNVNINAIPYPQGIEQHYTDGSTVKNRL